MASVNLATGAARHNQNEKNVHKREPDVTS
jgi:hypothetical protein